MVACLYSFLSHMRPLCRQGPNPAPLHPTSSPSQARTHTHTHTTTPHTTHRIPRADSIMVDSWEAEQRQYTRTLFVLQRVQRELGALFGAGRVPEPAEVGPQWRKQRPAWWQ